MSEYPDLSIMYYDNILAIGWLSKDSTYNTGPVDQSFYKKLINIFFSPWAPFATATKNFCEICQFNPPFAYKNVLCLTRERFMSPPS
jgi:hypothetical protein